MPKGISPQEAANRLTSAGIQLGDRYKTGTQGKGSKQVAGALAAVDNFNKGIQEAIAKGSFAKGVQEAGPSAFDQGVLNKGVNNWGTGMQLSGDKYLKKIAKFIPLWNQALATPRGAKRSPNNLKRMTENVDRFVRAKG